jgi:hypothetical protein
MLDELLYWIGGARTIWATTTGVPGLARWLLQRRGNVVKAGGFRFFPDRPTLQMAYGTLANRFVGVSDVDALLVVGVKFYRAQANLDKIKRLLLPNPDGETLKWFAETINGKDTSRVIKETTKLALKAGAKVKWYNHFNFHSMILADTDKPSGWAHIETVLPYSQPERRPSYTVHKQRSEQLVKEMQRVFDEIWDKSPDARA